MDLPLDDVTFMVAAGYSRIRAVSFLSRVKRLSCAPKLCRKVRDKAAAGSNLTLPGPLSKFWRGDEKRGVLQIFPMDK
jgi:hypothetical protein